jgi:hypothetical protein
VLFAGLTQATRIELGKVASARAGRWLIIASAAVGLMVAVIVGLTAEGLTFSLASFYVQSTISLPLPFVSILLITRDFDRRALSQTYMPIRSASRMVAAKLVASMIIALIAASYGIVLSVLVTNFAPTAAEEPWHGVGIIMIGSALVQLIAQLTGAGCGLLLGSNLAAMVADVAVPLGLWLVSGAVTGLRGVQVWLTPFAVVEKLLSGQMDAQDWAQVGIVAFVWIVGLNAAGILRLIAPLSHR